MFDIAQKLREFRKVSKLTLNELAKFLPIDAETLGALERGELPVEPELIANYAQIAGVEIDAFIRGEAADAPPSLLFRTLPHREASVEEMANTGVHLALGTFLRNVGRISRLRAQLKCSPNLSWLDPWRRNSEHDQLSSVKNIYTSAEDAAREFRQQHGLGNSPITSMVNLLQSLGIALFFVTPEELNPNIDGVSTVTPAPAIMVNLIEGSENWWRTRMTLAHELGHLLLDLPLQTEGTKVPLMLSPLATQWHHAPERWTLTLDHQRAEQRASAFAATLLAPPGSVRDLIGTQDPTSETSLHEIGRTFGVGRTTAINILTNIFNLKRDTRQQMMGRYHARWSSEQHFDEPTQIGLYVGLLEHLTLQALHEGFVDKVEARHLINLQLTDPLPDFEGLTDEDKAPLMSTHDVILRLVNQHLQQTLGPEYTAGEVHPHSEGWKVEVLKLQSRTEFKCVKWAQVSFDRQIKILDVLS